MTGELTLRSACVEDAPVLLGIYAPYVTDTAVSFEYDVPTVEEFQRRIETTLVKYPYIVAVLDGEIVGYCYASGFHTRRAYERSCELSVYVRRDKRGRGIGRALYCAMEDKLRKLGKKNLYACIAYPPEEDEYLTRDSVRFHERMGYSECGHFTACGEKFGREYDIVYMEKILK